MKDDIVDNLSINTIYLKKNQNKNNYSPSCLLLADVVWNVTNSSYLVSDKRTNQCMGCSAGHTPGSAIGSVQGLLWVSIKHTKHCIYL